MKQFIVTAATGETLLVYNNDVQIVFTQWPGCTQAEVIPPPPEGERAYAGKWVITTLAFRQRFTDPERVAIELAAVDDPNGNQATRNRAAALRAQLNDLLVTKEVNLKHGPLRAGVQALKAVGILTAARADIVLDTPPSAEETP